MNPWRSRTSGFTLVEVLVALAVMSLIGTILIESLRVGGHTWQRVTRAATNINEIAQAQHFLRQHLESIHPTDAAQDSFIGEQDAIEFSSVSDDPTHPISVRYWLGLSRSEPANLEVHYRLKSDMNGAVPSAWASESLVDGIAGLSIAYWSTDTSGGGWTDHWDGARKLPTLIRIEVQFAGRDPRSWPPLYIEPKLDTPLSCVFDIVGRRCRERT